MCSLGIWLRQRAIQTLRRQLNVIYQQSEIRDPRLIQRLAVRRHRVVHGRLAAVLQLIRAHAQATVEVNASCMAGANTASMMDYFNSTDFSVNSGGASTT